MQRRITLKTTHVYAIIMFGLILVNTHDHQFTIAALLLHWEKGEEHTRTRMGYSVLSFQRHFKMFKSGICEIPWLEGRPRKGVLVCSGTPV